MKNNIKAPLVQAPPDPMEALRLALEEQLTEVSTADNCFEADRSFPGEQRTW